jgi:hypothetical protein
MLQRAIGSRQFWELFRAIRTHFIQRRGHNIGGGRGSLLREATAGHRSASDEAGSMPNPDFCGISAHFSHVCAPAAKEPRVGIFGNARVLPERHALILPRTEFIRELDSWCVSQS